VRLPTRRDGTLASRSLVVLAYSDPVVLRALTFSLEIEGYDVRICDSSTALLALKLPDRRACLVLDQHLSRHSGLEALSILRKRDVNLPAVLITGQSRPWVRNAATAAGASLVELPLLADALLDAVRGALSA